jgi:hypothetical protein
MATATKAQVHWDRDSAANALNLMNMADHLTRLKDNYRRDCQGLLQQIEQARESGEWEKIKKFFGSVPDFSAAKFDGQIKEVEDILETLGGPITEKA